jgi:TfoX/Sxy family transcriptional regulator of competence genes
MVYDDGLVQRVRELMTDLTDFSEKKMFGGICFLIQGNMACGIIKYDVIVRIGPENYEDALKKPGVRLFDFTGRPMKGWVVVSAESHESDDQLVHWIKLAVLFTLSLPPK